jgi:hypothetical protein
MPVAAKATKPSLATIYDELESILAKFSPPFTPRKNVVPDKRNYILVLEKRCGCRRG